MNAVMLETIQTLLQWSADNQLQLQPSLRIQFSTASGIAVFSETFIGKNDIIASIPKAGILSTKSTSLAEKIPPAPYGLGAQLALSLAVCHELAQGTASRWHGYLQSLPPSTVPIALLWGNSDALDSPSDGEEAKGWIAGTEVERMVRGEQGQDPLDEIYQYYYSVARPLLPESCMISHFLHAYSLVSSRAFMVDAYHGLSMVPIADAFNHTTENHVHLECDYDVCPLCGSFAECPHDREDAPSSSSEPMDWQSPSVASVPDTCDMVANRPIPAFSEVFNTYGSRKSNASLLAWYGFALDENENDSVGWDFAEVAQAFGSDESSSVQLSEQLYKRILHAWLSTLGSMVAEDSRLVYRSDLDDAEQREFAGPSTVLCINSDAQISVYLWVYLAICAAFEATGSFQSEEKEVLGFEYIERLVALLGAIIGQQVFLEKALGAEGVELNMAGNPADETQSLAGRVLSRIAELAVTLCRRRISSMGKHQDLSTAQLGEMLDNVPESRPKTRLALAQVLAERAMLEGCQADWQELRDALEEDSS